MRDDGQWLRPKSIKKMVEVPYQEELSDVVGQSAAPWLECPKCGDYIVQADQFENGQYLVTCSRCHADFWITRQAAPEVEGQAVSAYPHACPVCGSMSEDTGTPGGKLRPVTCKHCGALYYSGLSLQHPVEMKQEAP